jgi:hypothetical protein
VITKHRLFSSLLFVVALCYGGVVFGQTAEGAGRVSDQNAAVIPDTEIVITNAETGVIRKAATNAEGYYSIPLSTNIPLNGRSPFRLAQITPGVLSSNSVNGQFGDIPVNTNNEDGSGAQLYHILRDPAESINLAAQRPDLARRLSEAARAWNRMLPR